MSGLSSLHPSSARETATEIDFQGHTETGVPLLSKKVSLMFSPNELHISENYGIFKGKTSEGGVTGPWKS